MKWRPIETAPIEEDVLVTDGEEICLCAFLEKHGWSCTYSTYIFPNPTQWMPLPKLPKL